MLTKDQILAAKDHRQEWVPLEAWCPAGETFNPDVHGVFVGTMSSTEMDTYEDNLFRSREATGSAVANIRGLIAALCVRTRDGKRMFDVKDAEMLGEKSGSALDAILDAVLKLNPLLCNKS